MTNKEFAAWLEEKYIVWMGETGKRRTLSEFAEYLGVSQPLLSQWLNGKYLPNKENVARLADRLGLDVYDLVGLQQPDPDAHRLVSLYWNMDESHKRKLLNYAEQLSTQSSEQE